MQSRHLTVSTTFFVYAYRGTSSIVFAGGTRRVRAILPPMPATCSWPTAKIGWARRGRHRL